MRTGVFAKPFSPAGTCEMRSTTSMPSVTRPKVEYWPSREGWGTTQMKNWLPSLFALPGIRAVETDAALVLQIAEFARQQVQAAGTPQVLRCLRVLQKRVAALNDAVRHHPMERAAVIVALPGEADELLDVLRGFIGREFKPERAEVGRNHGFEFSRRRRLSLTRHEPAKRERQEPAAALHDRAIVHDQGGIRIATYKSGPLCQRRHLNENSQFANCSSRIGRRWLLGFLRLSETAPRICSILFH